MLASSFLAVRNSFMRSCCLGMLLLKMGEIGMDSNIRISGTYPSGTIVLVIPLTANLSASFESELRYMILKFMNARLSGPWFFSPTPIEMWDCAPESCNIIPCAVARFLKPSAANLASWSRIMY